MNIKQALARLLRALPISSEYLGPPKGVKRYSDSYPYKQEQISLCRESQTATVSAFPFVGQKNYTSEVIYTVSNPPAKLYTDSLNRFCSWKSPEAKVSIHQNARIWGKNGELISDSDYLIEESVNRFHLLTSERMQILKKLFLGQCKRLDKTAAIIGGKISQGGYYHWLIDTLPRIEILKMAGIPFDFLYAGPITSSFQVDTLKSLGFPKEKILRVTDRFHVKFQKVLLPSFPSKGLDFSPWALDCLKFAFLKSSPTRQDRKIYVSRSKAARRRVMNENVIKPLLEKHSIDYICQVIHFEML